MILYLSIKTLRSEKQTDRKLLYWSTLALAILTSLTYFSGPGTADWVKGHFNGYSQELLENHALWGRLGFLSSILIGLPGLMALINYAQGEKPHRSIPMLILILILINTFIFIYTTHLGGLIRRPDLLQ